MAEEEKPVPSGDHVPPGPVVLAINICDMAIRDARTNKVSLIGLFGTIHAREFPCTHPLMVVHIALTGGHGTQSIEIRLVRIEDEQPVIGVMGDWRFSDPLQVNEFIFEWGGVRFDKPGNYAIEVCCPRDAIPIGSRKFSVVQITETPSTPIGQGE